MLTKKKNLKTLKHKSTEKKVSGKYTKTVIMAMSRGRITVRFCFLSFEKHQFLYSEACITSSKKYLFIYLFDCAESSLLRVEFLHLQCKGFLLRRLLCFRAQLLWRESVGVRCVQALQFRLNSCGSQAGCSTSCGIIPDQGSNPSPLRWQSDS